MAKSMKSGIRCLLIVVDVTQLANNGKEENSVGNWNCEASSSGHV